MNICVVGIGIEPPSFLARLSDVFSAKISFGRMPIPKSAFDVERKQWSAEKILKALREENTTRIHADKVLGVADIDIYVRRMNFVFGLSEIGGSTSLISVYRYHPELYGKRKQGLFEDRTVKEAIHELGHAFGLQHCNNKCVMHFSNTIEEVDRKPKTFCKECIKQLSLL
ncbi:MAG: archaemetzincin family Zn-dependent metalloprotease [Candidatus Micrarchaeia archaeon]